MMYYRYLINFNKLFVYPLDIEAENNLLDPNFFMLPAESNKRFNTLT